MWVWGGGCGCGCGHGYEYLGMRPLCFPVDFFSNGDVAEDFLNSTLHHRNMCLNCVYVTTISCGA